MQLYATGTVGMKRDHLFLVNGRHRTSDRNDSRRNAMESFSRTMDSPEKQNADEYALLADVIGVVSSEFRTRS